MATSPARPVSPDKPAWKKPYDKDAAVKKPWVKSSEYKGARDSKDTGDKKPWVKSSGSKPYENSSASGKDAGAGKTWVKKPWVKAAESTDAGAANSGDKKPWGKKPWVKHTDAPPNGSTDAGDNKSWVKKPWIKKPWQDSNGPKPDAKAGPKPHRKGSSFAGGPAKHETRAPETTAPRSSEKVGSSEKDGSKPGSKYAFKKKNRPPAAAE